MRRHRLLMVCAGGCLAVASPAAGQSVGPRVVLLGTGTPNADPERSGPATAVIVGDRAFIVDAGPGVVRRAAAAARKWGEPSLAPPALRTVLLTHLHSDHTAGLPDLMLTPWTLERTAPLTVIGPPGTRAMTKHLQAAYALDVKTRREGLEPANATGFAVRAAETKGGVVYRDSLVTITAIRVPHGNWDTALAYRFDVGPWRAVISGDTSPSDAIVAACDGCDVLVHEVYSARTLSVRPPEWQRYHRAVHTSTVELAAIATRARAKTLVLTHLLLWGATGEALADEVRAAGFTGRVIAGVDLDRIP